MDDTITDPLAAMRKDIGPQAKSSSVRSPSADSTQGRLTNVETGHEAPLSNLERALREAQAEKARWQTMVESSEDAIIGKTLDGNILSWNNAAERLYGYTAEEVVGRCVDFIIPKERAGELMRILDKVKRGERIQRYETVRVKKDGTTAQVSVSVSPIKDVDGHIIGAASIARDITARKHAEEVQRFLAEAVSELSNSLDYETTLDCIAQLAVPTLADICVVDVINNHSVRQIATARAGQVYDECLRLIQAQCSLDPDSPHPVWDVLRTGEPFLWRSVSDAAGASDLGDAQLQSALREAGMESCMVVPLTIRGCLAGTISLISVDSRRHYSQEDLTLAQELAARAAVAIDNARLYRDAREAVRACDEFLSVAAHELKTPMTSLRGFAQLAVRQLDRDGTPDPVQVRQALKVIDQQSRKLSNLISQLLVVSRLEAGRLSLERQIVDIGRLVEGVVSLTPSTSAEHSIVVRIPAVVLGLVDPMRVEQVLINLLDNAIRYSPSGSLVEVELSQPSRDTIRLSVRDWGPGIPPELRGRIFTRFSRPHGGDQIGGMGLGLYISHEVVLLHGGKIEAEFPEDGGTRFVVTLPSGLSEGEMVAD